MSNAFLLGIVKAIVAVAIVTCSIAIGQTAPEAVALFAGFVIGGFILPHCWLKNPRPGV